MFSAETIVNFTNLESLLSPRTVGGVGDGTERRDGAVLAGVLQMADEGAVPTHGMAADADPVHVDREESANILG